MCGKKIFGNGNNIIDLKNLNPPTFYTFAYKKRYTIYVLSVPKFTANMYCICLSIPQIYT